MNIQQTRLNNNEKTLLEKVIDFSLTIGSNHICFNNIVDKVGLDLTIPRKYNEENLGKEQLERLSKRIKELEREIERWEKTRESIDWFHLSDEERSAIYVTFPWRKRYPAWTIHDYIPLLRDQKSNIERIVDQSRIITPLLGCFNADEQKVNLYTNNIEESNSKRFLPLISTFIHEMFHAWNFFESGCRDRTIREIDEAMVEFGTLYFLQEISKTDDVFTQVFEWYKECVREKQKSIGEVAAYGFGYYLYYITQDTLENKKALKLLELYGKKSGHIKQSSKDVKSIEKALYPFYPSEEEDKILKLFYSIIKGESYKRNGGLHGWSQEVLEYITKIPSNDFTLDEFYFAFAEEIQQKHPGNKNIRAKIRQQLQILCDQKKIQRISNGKYEILCELNAKDDAESVKWYRKFAERGNVDAQDNLGWMYQNGYEINQDYKEAVDEKKSRCAIINKPYQEQYDLILQHTQLLTDTQETQQHIVEPVKKRLETVPIEELLFFFPSEKPIVNRLRNGGFTNLGQLYEASTQTLLNIPHVGILSVEKLKKMRDDVRNHADNYANAWENSQTIHYLPSNYDREKGLHNNLLKAFLEYAQIIASNLNNKRYIRNVQEHKTYALISSILKKYFSEDKNCQQIAEEENYTLQHVEILKGKCISEIINGKIIFKHYRLNQSLVDLLQSLRAECLFDPLRKIEAYVGSSDTGLFKDLGYDTLMTKDITILIPKDKKGVYQTVWGIILKTLLNNPLPTERVVIENTITTSQELSDIEYNELFIEKILTNLDLVDDLGDNLIQIKKEYLTSDAQRVARIIYEAGVKLTKKEIRERYETIYGGTIAIVPTAVRQYGISCQGKQFWYYGQPKKSLQQKVTEYAEDKIVFFFDEIEEEIKQEGYTIPQAFRVYITNVCAIDNKDKNHFCHKDYVDDYPQYSWRNPSQYGLANWIYNEIQNILSSKNAIPLQEMIEELEERSHATEFHGVRKRIQYNDMADFCGADKPFIVIDGLVSINHEIYSNTDFETIGLRGGKYAFFKQIRALVANEVKKDESGRKSLVDIITLVKENIDQSLGRNVILRAIKDEQRRFAPIDVEITNDSGLLYVQWLKQDFVPEPVYVVTSVEDAPETENIIEVKEIETRPGIKYRQGVNWKELNKALKRELSYYSKMMSVENIELNDAIDSFTQYIAKSRNANLSQILPQDLYEYWFASTDSFDRYRYLRDLLSMFEGLLSEIYYDLYGEKPRTKGLSDLAASFEGLPDLLLYSSDAKGFNRIASKLLYQRNKIAHGEFLEMSSVEIAYAITNYVALYVYAFAKYHQQE